MTLPTFFLSHGGGPWPFVAGPMRDAHAALEASLRGLPGAIGARPTAVLLVSAHWQTPAFTVQSSPAPGMLYDYHGFPPETYQVRYPAPGAPALAAAVQRLAADAGMACDSDGERGYDHGVFVPMSVAFPQADVPVLQLSLRADGDPAAHVAIGRALAPLRAQGVLIAGSGMSFHNLRTMRSPQAAEPSQRFDAWLAQTMALTGAGRSAALCDWALAPSARSAHPSAEHLLPLLVAAGAAEQEAARLCYHEDRFLGSVTVSSYCIGTSASA